MLGKEGYLGVRWMRERRSLPGCSKAEEEGRSLFQCRDVSDAVTCPRPGWVEESSQGPREMLELLAPRQGDWVWAPLWHRDLFILLISGHN